MKLKVFVSYAAADKEVVKRLEAHFVAVGISVWVDYAEIQVGDRLTRKINDGLKWCEIFCLVWSKAACRSKWVALEWENALTCGKRIVPIRIDQTQLPELLSSNVYHALKLTENGFVEIANKLKESFMKWTSTSSQDNAPNSHHMASYKSLTGVLKIKGGVPLTGEVTVRGAKNTLPRHLVASLLTEEECTLANVADVWDVRIVSDMIRALGGSIRKSGDKLKISTGGISVDRLQELLKFGEVSRVPILFCGPLLQRFGKAFIPQLGGCRLNGPSGRKTDMHERILRQMGASLKRRNDGGFEVESRTLKNSTIKFRQKSVGATEQALLTAARIEGTTHIVNAAIDPEVIDLINLLTSMGAQITWHKSHRIEIHGRRDLRGFNHRAMTDRSEIASWACAAAATNGEITVVNAKAEDMMGFNNKFREIGGEIIEGENKLTFRRKGKKIYATDIRTGPHPEFRSDWQPPFVALLTQAIGESLVHETVFSDRFGYTITLNSLGADIEVLDHCIGGDCSFAKNRSKHSAIVRGPSRLHGGSSRFVDLRGAFATLIAALVAKDETTIHDSAWLEKGYEDIKFKLEGIGAKVKSTPDL